MHTTSRLLARPLLLLAALAAASCDDAPTTPPTPETSVPGAVILDVTGALVATFGDADTFEISVPNDRELGVIIESPDPIVVWYGPSSRDAVYSLDGGTLAAIGTPESRSRGHVVVRHMWNHILNIPYRLRVIAVEPKPEHTEAGLSPSSTFRSEWIDPPLDLDVFTIDFEAGDRFSVELQSEDEDVRVAARVVTPDGLVQHLFQAAGTELTRSPIYRTDSSGEHTLMVYSAGLDPDVEARYRFRVVAEAAESAPADH